MNDVLLFFRAALIGFVVAAPVGPVNLLCIRRALERGRRSGIASGLGAATADALYASIGHIGAAVVSAFLIKEHNWIRLVAGVVLLVIAVTAYIARPPEREVRQQKETLQSDAMTTFLLTLTNPSTILTFGAIFAVFGASGERGPMSFLATFCGILLGSGVWYTLVVHFVERLRDRATPDFARQINRELSLFIGATGLFIFLGAARALLRG